MKDLKESLLDDEIVDKHFEDTVTLGYIQKFYNKHFDYHSRRKNDIEVGDIVLGPYVSAVAVGIVLAKNGDKFVVCYDGNNDINRYKNKKGELVYSYRYTQLIKIDKDALKYICK